MSVTPFPPIVWQRQSGFSILEILVSIVVISLGLLGLAGLQASSLRNNQTAYLRSLASQHAYDMADRMRANLTGVTSGNYNDLNGDIDLIWTTRPELEPACLDGDSCSVGEIATEDYRQWRASLDRAIPGGGGEVCLSESATPDLTYPCDNTCEDNYQADLPFVIQVTWTEKEESGNTTQGFCTAFRP